MPLFRVVPLVLVGMVWGLELFASRGRRGDVASSDRGSLYLIFPLIALGYGAAFGLWGQGRLPLGWLGDWAMWTGAAVTLAGVGLRAWSVVTLGHYFTYLVKVTPDQKVVDTGPYRLIRHPSYTGGLLAGIGIGLSLRYALAPVLIGATSLIAYLIRIRVEETALAQAIGAPYRAYMARTRRLIPFLW